MKIFKELWFGNILPHERDAAPKSRLERLGRLIVRNEEELDPLLSERAKEVFEKLMENQADRTRLNECEAFVYGFRLAWQKILCKRYSTKSRMALWKQGGIWRTFPW